MPQTTFLQQGLMILKELIAGFIMLKFTLKMHQSIIAPGMPLKFGRTKRQIFGYAFFMKTVTPGTSLS